MQPLSLIQNSTETGELLPVMEQFYTLQGEGMFTGQAAYFVRLGGCDVGCVWCDVKESWDVSRHPLLSIDEIIKNATAHPGKIIVVTGGEPAMHQLETFTNAIKNSGKRTHIETSGAHPLTGDWDWVCLSPKKFKQPLPEIYAAAHELKIIVFNKSDLQYAEQNAARVNPDCHLYLQPEWSKRGQISPLIVDYIKQHPQWKFSLQTHKYIDIP